MKIRIITAVLLIAALTVLICPVLSAAEEQRQAQNTKYDFTHSGSEINKSASTDQIVLAYMCR